MCLCVRYGCSALVHECVFWIGLGCEQEGERGGVASGQTFVQVGRWIGEGGWWDSRMYSYK